MKKAVVVPLAMAMSLYGCSSATEQPSAQEAVEVESSTVDMSELESMIRQADIDASYMTPCDEVNDYITAAHSYKSLIDSESASEDEILQAIESLESKRNIAVEAHTEAVTGSVDDDGRKLSNMEYLQEGKWYSFRCVATCDEYVRSATHYLFTVEYGDDSAQANIDIRDSNHKTSVKKGDELWVNGKLVEFDYKGNPSFEINKYEVISQ